MGAFHAARFWSLPLSHLAVPQGYSLLAIEGHPSDGDCGVHEGVAACHNRGHFDKMSGACVCNGGPTTPQSTADPTQTTAGHTTLGEGRGCFCRCWWCRRWWFAHSFAVCASTRALCVSCMCIVVCVAFGLTCVCASAAGQPAFFGETCEFVRCPNDCNMQGLCQRDTGVCACWPGYYGEDCRLKRCPSHHRLRFSAVGAGECTGLDGSRVNGR